MSPFDDPKFREEYKRGIESDIERTKRDLAPLESGEMKLGRRRPGHEWEDITHEMISQHKAAIQTYERILMALKERESKA